MPRRRLLAIALAILAVAAVVRLPALFAGLPYSSYVDEGHLLHLVVPVLAGPSWTPGEYYYPTLPVYLVAGAAAAYAPVYRWVHGHPLREDLPPHPFRYYDLMGPPELLVLARAISLAFSLGLVALVGLLGLRMAGPAAGLSAAWMAALLPALVTRSSIATVNPHATFFVVAALLCAELARRGDRFRWWAAVAGACAGLAGASKYPAAVVALPVALAVLLASEPWRERALALVAAAVAAVAALVVAMPPLLLRTREVLAALREDSAWYATRDHGSYWLQAVRRAEWDIPLERPELGLPFLLLAAAGVAVGLQDRRWRPAVACWALFAGVMGVLLARYTFRPFRNLLPLVPLACVLAALLYAYARDRLRRPLAADLAAFVLPLVLFAPTLADYVRHQLTLEDSRHTVARWLAGNVRRQDRVLVVEELAFLPTELTAIPTSVDVERWRRVRWLIGQRHYRYVVLARLHRQGGRHEPAPAEVASIFDDYAMAMHAGNPDVYVPLYGWVHRGNDLGLYVLRRKGRPGPRPPRGNATGAPPSAAAAPSGSPRSPTPSG